MKIRLLFRLGLILLGAGFILAAAPPRKEKTRTPPAFPILLPRLEHGDLDPVRVGALLDGPLHEATRVAHGTSLGCVELTSLDRSGPDSIDVHHYDIRIDDVDEAAKTFSGVTSIRILALKSLNRFDLDLAFCVVDSVEVALYPQSFAGTTFVQRSAAPDSIIKILSIDLPHPVQAGDSLLARVRYRGTSGCFNPHGLAAGLVFTPVGTHTFSEPAYARQWYPCHDVPWDKATASLFIGVPAGRVASASGVNGTQIYIDGRLFERWDTAIPVSTYLNAFYLGNYVTLTDATTDDIPLEYFVYPELEDKARVDFENVPDMVEFFSTFFPYPFPRYAMSLGYFGGGMEHVMNSLIGYFFIRGDRSYETLWAHELAHQWWGDMVTVGQWRDIWLNEGFAVFFDWLYTEHRYGTPAMQDRIAFIDSVLQALPDSLNHPILDPPLIDPFSTIVYYKGAFVLHMLRGISRFELMNGPPEPPEAHQAAAEQGDERFNSIFTEYARRYMFRNVTTADFQEVAEEKLAEGLDWFFDPWLNGTGFPTWQLDWTATTHATGQFVEVHIRQAATDPTPFTTFLPVRYRSGNTVLDEVRRISSDSTSWIVSLPEGNWSVELDPDNWILNKTERVPLIDSGRPLEISPNPSVSGFTLKASLKGSNPAHAELVVHDLSGRRVRTIDMGTVLPGPLSMVWDARADDGTEVGAGVYFARLSLGTTTAVARLVLLR